MSPAQTHDVHRGALPFPRSLPEFQRLFPNDAACGAYLERCRWPELFRCPACGAGGDPFRFAARPGVLRCRACRRDTSLTAGTIMHRTHSPLSTWFWAAYLVAGGPNRKRGGLTITETAALLGERYATVQEMMARMRDGGGAEGPRGWQRLRAALGMTERATLKKGPKPRDLRELFFSRVNTDGPVPSHCPELGPCHLWTGTISRGYGVLSVEGRPVRTHRIAFFLAEGRWPECALHKCDNPPCVRRSHLFEGDRTDNAADKMTKGRHPRKLDDAGIQAVLALKSEGWTQTAIAEHLGVSDSLVSYVVRLHRVA